MNLPELEACLQALVGERVTAKTIAANSISLWFSVDPKAPTARRLWIDPPWRVETLQGIESTCEEFPGGKEDDEADSEYRVRFDAACRKTDVLKETVLQSAAVDHATCDLTLRFSGGRTLRKFSTDLGYENWHFTDHQARKRYGAWVNKVDVEDTDA